MTRRAHAAALQSVAWLLLVAACADEGARPALMDPGVQAPVDHMAGSAGAAASPPAAGVQMGAAGGSMGVQPGQQPAPGDGAQAPTGADTDGVPTPQQPAAPERVLTENILVPAVPPGAEATVCLTKQLTNPVAEQVVEVRAHISPGSHHFIVDRSPTDIQIPQLTPCLGLSGTDQSRILIAEKPETVFSLPPGVVFGLRPTQNLTMELHYINYTEEPLDVEGRIELVLAPEGSEAGNQEAGMIFTGNTGIALLPGQQATIEFFGIPAATPQAPVHVFAMTSHTHALGVRSWIERVPSALEPSGELLHESHDWASPPLDVYDPPLTFTGTDGVRLRCELNNTTDRLVTFGTGFNDEMCFMWLYYYPNTGAFF